MIVDVAPQGKPDKCRCSKCGGKFNVSDLDVDFGNHDGWEMPPYGIHICSNCEDGGCIDDYWYSNPHLALQLIGGPFDGRIVGVSADIMHSGYLCMEEAPPSVPPLSVNVSRVSNLIYRKHEYRIDARSHTAKWVKQ